MSETSETGCIFPAEQFTGELAIGEKRVPVSLTASAGLSGKLELNVEPISLSGPSDGVRALLGSFSKPGIMIDEFGLDCGTPDGKRLTSDRAYLAGYNRNSDGMHIKLRTSEASLMMAAHKSHDCPVLRLQLLGFSCHPPVRVETALGSVAVRGATRTTAADKISGSIVVAAPDGSQSTTWRQSAEHMLRHLRSVLAFARGAPLNVPVTEFYEGEGVEVTFHETDGGDASLMPPLSHFGLKPVVATAMANVKTVDDYRDSFETAIGWFLVPTTFDEVRFLSGMTALDALASRSLERSRTSILGRQAWEKFSKRVRALVDEQSDFDDPTKCAVKAKIPELNKLSFIQKTRSVVGTLACFANVHSR